MLKISVITVVYNSVQYIEQTIKSVLEQNYPNLEYIIIDGGSFDGTQDIIRQYEKYITYWCSEPDNGIYDAMNKGIDRATGELVAFLNSGDKYLPDTLNRLVESYIKDVADVVYGDCIIYNHDGKQTYEKKDAPIDELRYHMILCHQAVFVKKKMFELYGKYSGSYKIADDYEWFLRVYKQGASFKYVSYPICYYLNGGLSQQQERLCARDSINIALSYACDQETKRRIEAYNFEWISRLYWDGFISDIISGYNRDVFKRILADMGVQEKIYIFGAGYYGCQCIAWCKCLEIEIAGIIDNDAQKWNKQIEGIPIVSLEQIYDKEIFIITASLLYGEEIEKQLLSAELQKGIDFVDIKEIMKHVVENSDSDIVSLINEWGK